MTGALVCKFDFQQIRAVLFCASSKSDDICLVHSGVDKPSHVVKTIKQKPCKMFVSLCFPLHTFPQLQTSLLIELCALQTEDEKPKKRQNGSCSFGRHESSHCDTILFGTCCSQGSLPGPRVAAALMITFLHSGLEIILDNWLIHWMNYPHS